jgi:plastocyanin
MKRIFSIIAIVFAIALTASAASPSAALAAAEDPSTGAKNDVTIVIDNFTFMAPNLTIPAGTKVTWINHDDVPHTVVSTEQKFKSKALDTDESFSFTFTEPGKYPYFCSIHPKMVANVVVTEKK